MANDFGKVWKADATGNDDRKRLLALLVEDVTLMRDGYQAQVSLRLRGGRTVTLEPVDLPRPRATVVRRHASDTVLCELEEMVCEGAFDDIAAEELNRRGHRDSRGDPFTRRSVYTIRKRMRWPSAIERNRQQLRERGYMDAKELGDKLGIDPASLRMRVIRGDRAIQASGFRVGKRTFSMYKLLSVSANKAGKNPKIQAR